MGADCARLASDGRCLPFFFYKAKRLSFFFSSSLTDTELYIYIDAVFVC